VGLKMDFEILYNFPFSSDRKRMGIIIREKATDKVFFLVKGADFIMKDLVP
jgi:phospholipid-translocating ATPase